MAIAFDASSESHTGTTGSASQASFSWTHAGGSDDLAGVVVYTFTNADADNATAVTYDGRSLSAVSGGRAVDTAGEPGDCKAWFLSQGPETVAVTGTWRRGQSGTSTQLNAIAYGGGYWVAVGNSGTILYTTNLSRGFTAATSGTSENLTDVAYGDGNWVVVGGATNGVMLVASDPTGTWSQPSSTPSLTSKSLKGVAHGDDGYWVAVGAIGFLVHATDPAGTWTQATFPTTILLSGATYSVLPKAVAYGNGEWGVVAQGGNGRVYYNTDPTTAWSNTDSNANANGYDDGARIAYGNGYWVTVLGTASANISYREGDLRGSWPSQSAGVSATYTGVAYGDGYWVVVGGSTIRYRASSPNGTWSAGSGGSNARGLAYGNSQWGTVGTSGTMRLAGNIRRLIRGNATVSVTRTNNANVMYGVAATVTGNYPSAEVSAVSLEEGDQTLAEENVNDGSNGYPGLRFAAVNSGLGAVDLTTTTTAADTLVLGANSTALQSIDFGDRVIGVVRETTAGQGSRPVGFQSTTSDDVAAVYLAIREAIVPWTVGVPIR